MNKIDKAVEVLNNGGIIIFPTDTAFGIGCRIDNQSVVKKLFEIRKRPNTQAAPVLVSNLEMVKRYVSQIPENVKEKLIKPYWPGALTIVLPCENEAVDALVRGGTNTIGIRMPGNKQILEIIEKVGVPILGPSANFHGQLTPYEFKDLDRNLVSLVDYVLDGECSVKKPSTVVDCTVSPWNILRKGAIEIKI